LSALGWMILVASLGLFFGVGTLLRGWDQRQLMRKAERYRISYCQLVGRLDSIRAALFKLTSSMSAAKHGAVVHELEGLVQDVERLVVATRQLEHFSTDDKKIAQILITAEELLGRFAAVQGLVMTQGAEPNAPVVSRSKLSKQLRQGCYFCSMPHLVGEPRKVKVRIDGKILAVMACLTCFKALNANKKVKVLFFMRDGKALHWTRVRDYVMEPKYFSINRGDPEGVPKTDKLKLVESSVTKFADADSDSDLN
jgi:hypothetical protein